MNEKVRAVIDFWNEIGPKAWFEKSDAIDASIREKFGDLHRQAANGELDDWKNEADSCLALILVLDQFSRNMFREDARAFATDEYAADLANFALDNRYPDKVADDLKSFFVMPFMHSERIADQERCVLLFHKTGGPDGLKYAIIHRDIIARFGRFPHRNKVLCRHTTPAEQAFLDAGGFSG